MNTASPLENISNIGVSIAEDVFVGIVALLALKVPYLATFLVLIAVVLLVIFIPPLLRWSFYTIRAFGRWLSSLWNRARQKEIQSDILPAEHLALLHEHPPKLAAECKAQNIKGADGCTGYLSSWGDRLVFSYNKWWASHTWYIDRTQILSTHLYQRPLTDILEITYQGLKGESHIARFVFLKDRAPLAVRLTQSLA